jgi:hypothetical protein
MWQINSRCITVFSRHWYVWPICLSLLLARSSQVHHLSQTRSSPLIKSPPAMT